MNFHVRLCMNKILTIFFLHLILELLLLLVIPANLKILTRKKKYFSVFRLFYMSYILITVYIYPFK